MAANAPNLIKPDAAVPNAEKKFLPSALASLNNLADLEISPVIA